MIPLTTGWSFVAVRDGLRSGERERIDRAVTPLYTKCMAPLQRFASGLIRQGEAAGLSVGKDSEDIAIEALDKVFTFVLSENGDRIRDEIHLLRILFRAARCAWVDALRLPDTQYSRPRTDIPKVTDETLAVASESDSELFGTGKTALIALQLLFRDGGRVGLMSRKSGAGTRHFRQYQALALYELGERLRNDLEDASPEAEFVVLHYWRQFSVDTLGVRQSDWFLLESAVRSSIAVPLDLRTHLYEPIRAAVEAVCGADVQNRSKRQLLRHEMGRILMKCRAEIESIGWE